ncbi:hypothetical protein L9F63_027145, partial [Diploptera punctata]
PTQTPLQPPPMPPNLFPLEDSSYKYEQTVEREEDAWNTKLPPKFPTAADVDHRTLVHLPQINHTKDSDCRIPPPTWTIDRCYRRNWRIDAFSSFAKRFQTVYDDDSSSSSTTIFPSAINTAARPFQDIEDVPPEDFAIEEEKLFHQKKRSHLEKKKFQKMMLTAKFRHIVKTRDCIRISFFTILQFQTRSSSSSAITPTDNFISRNNSMSFMDIALCSGKGIHAMSEFF